MNGVIRKRHLLLVLRTFGPKKAWQFMWCADRTALKVLMQMD